MYVLFPILYHRPDHYVYMLRGSKHNSSKNLSVFLYVFLLFNL